MKVAVHDLSYEHITQTDIDILDKLSGHNIKELPRILSDDWSTIVYISSDTESINNQIKAMRKLGLSVLFRYNYKKATEDQVMLINLDVDANTDDYLAYIER